MIWTKLRRLLTEGAAKGVGVPAFLPVALPTTIDSPSQSGTSPRQPCAKGRVLRDHKRCGNYLIILNQQQCGWT